MATGREAPATARPSIPSVLKAYAVPFLLFSLSMFYQLVVLPRSFPPTHYDVLGVRKYGSIVEVIDAYEKLSSKWNSNAQVPSTVEFLEIRYAYELLSNPIWKRDYDIFGIDENLHVLDKLKAQYKTESITQVGLPLLHAKSPDSIDYASNAIDPEEFIFSNAEPRLLQVYSFGSIRCDQFSKSWKEIASLLDGIANTGIIELGATQLAASLAERKPPGKLFFRTGLPALVALPAECKRTDCLIRYEGDLSVDAVTDWFATSVLGLPRILYYSKDTLGKLFLSKSGPHKVKVIFFSKTGMRATPYMRQIARDYQAYASFALVLWREEDFSIWWNAFEVESAPAVVFMKDPGVKPIVFHGSFNNSWLSDVMEKNKLQVLPQLRSVTSMELGCDARGHSRAGKDSTSWYCVILAGRLSPELNKMRETIRRVQDQLSNDGASSDVDGDQSSLVATVLKNKRLTFAWLDGEAQQKYCFFYLHSDTSYDTCGPRRDLADVPGLFIVRFNRNTTEENNKGRKNTLEDENADLASQLVARYNGSDEISQIIKWISETVRDGETRDLPSFKTKTPELIPEESDPIWSKGAQTVLSKSVGIKQKINRIKTKIYDHVGDPRIGPILLLGALMSYGTLWLMRSQPSQPSRSTQPTQDETGQKRRDRRRKISNKNAPPSITDEEPKGAYQMSWSDSESD